MRELTTYEVEHILDALIEFDKENMSMLTVAEAAKLQQDFRQELARRERAASERNIEPKARAVQYNRAGAIVTVYETPMAAQGVRAPKESNGPKVKITDIDQLLMLVGDPELEVPSA